MGNYTSCRSQEEEVENPILVIGPNQGGKTTLLATYEWYCGDASTGSIPSGCGNTLGGGEPHQSVGGSAEPEWIYYTLPPVVATIGCNHVKIKVNPSSIIARRTSSKNPNGITQRSPTNAFAESPSGTETVCTAQATYVPPRLSTATSPPPMVATAASTVGPPSTPSTVSIITSSINISQTKNLSLSATLSGSEMELNLYDVSGGVKIYPIWSHYLEKAKAIVFVVDCEDKSFTTDDECDEKSEYLMHSPIESLKYILGFDAKDCGETVRRSNMGSYKSSDSSSYKSMSEKRIPLLLVCNKVDKLRSEVASEEVRTPDTFDVGITNSDTTEKVSRDDTTTIEKVSRDDRTTVEKEPIATSNKTTTLIQSIARDKLKLYDLMEAEMEKGGRPRMFNCLAVSSKTGEGIKETLNWLVQAVKRQ